MLTHDRRGMGWWRLWLDSLDSNGGHLFLLATIIIVGMVLLKFQWSAQKAGAMLAMLKTVSSNREQQGTSSTLTAEVKTLGAVEDKGGEGDTK
jgi:hypothetical protein